MAFTKEFKDKIIVSIDEILKPHGEHSLFLLKTIWEYDNAFDFIYGQKTGLIIGFISGYYLATYGKKPSEIEVAEISEIVQLRKNEIRNSVRQTTEREC